MHALQRLVRIVSKAHKICNVKVLEIAATLHGPEALACPEIGSQVAAHMLIPSRTGASKTTNWTAVHSQVSNLCRWQILAEAMIYW